MSFLLSSALSKLWIEDLWNNSSSQRGPLSFLSLLPHPSQTSFCKIKSPTVLERHETKLPDEAFQIDPSQLLDTEPTELHTTHHTRVWFPSFWLLLPSHLKLLTRVGKALFLTFIVANIMPGNSVMLGWTNKVRIFILYTFNIFNISLFHTVSNNAENLKVYIKHFCFICKLRGGKGIKSSYTLTHSSTS